MNTADIRRRMHAITMLDFDALSMDDTKALYRELVQMEEAMKELPRVRMALAEMKDGKNQVAQAVLDKATGGEIQFAIY